jgi:1,4-alpha-glucan branching enzyme
VRARAAGGGALAEPGGDVSAGGTSRDGALALVLHSHMPYVEGFGTWPFGEEWLWEAVACVYLPLLDLLDGAAVTLGLTPVLCDQLETMRGEAGDRYVRFLRDVRAPIHAEDAAGLEASGEPELAAEVRRSAEDYTRAEQRFEEHGRDLVSAFGALRGVELWTSAATHGLLPLMATDAGLRLQVATGIASHTSRFGDWGGGFWLPECAYVPGLERELADHGVRAFCVDQTRVPGFHQLAPVATEAGPVAVPIDWDTVELVWNDESGYPANGTYRNYWGRTVHDLKPWSNAGQPYDQKAALALAREHARDFVRRASERVAGGGLLCCALDTELLGHWWYEGIAWLEAVLHEVESQGVRLVTVSEGVELAGTSQRALEPSTWGQGKDFKTWDGPAVAQLAFDARAAELRTVAAVARHGAPHAALERAARELLALQASDWSFMVTRDLAADYPLERMRLHGASLDAALAALTDSAAAPDPSLRGLAPHLDPSPLTTP